VSGEKKTYYHEGHEVTRRKALAERWQLEQIVFWHLLDWLSRFTPSGQSTANHECTKALFS
jgi:hypothetical protein